MSVKFIYKSDGNVDIVVAPEIPVSPRTFRQLLANWLVIDRIRAEKIDISQYSDLLTLLEKKRSGCIGEAFAAVEEKIREMIQLGDIDQLEALLLNLHQEFEPYRILSPLVSKFSTDETRRLLPLDPGIKSSSHKRDGIAATRIR